MQIFAKWFFSFQIKKLLSSFLKLKIDKKKKRNSNNKFEKEKYQFAIYNIFKKLRESI